MGATPDEPGEAKRESILAKTGHLKSWLVVSLRPYNPEGVSFIHDIEFLENRWGWKVNKKSEIHFDKPADQYELIVVTNISPLPIEESGFFMVSQDEFIPEFALGL